MARFSKALRQSIVREFAARHGGLFIPEEFLEEVRSRGEQHPAYEWFEWDQDRAALQYQVEQARDFARDLTVSFSVETIGRNQTITVREFDAPFALSPLAGRKGGGGYFLTDPSNPEHMAELCRQAASDLEAWLRRYRAALIHVHGSPASIERQLSALGGAEEAAEAAA